MDKGSGRNTTTRTKPPFSQAPLRAHFFIQGHTGLAYTISLLKVRVLAGLCRLPAGNVAGAPRAALRGKFTKLKLSAAPPTAAFGLLSLSVAAAAVAAVVAIVTVVVCSSALAANTMTTP